MRFFSQLLALVSLLVSVSAIPVPDSGSTDNSAAVTTFVAHITDITYQLGNLTSLANGIQKNQILSALKLQGQVITLIKTLDQTTSDLKKVSNFTQQEAITVASPVLQLSTPIQNTLTAIVNKKSTFDHLVLGFVSISFIVKGDIQVLLGRVNTLADALKSRLPSAFQPAVVQVVTGIQNNFNSALQAYSSTPLLNF